jgi:hypothetical protein
LNSHERRPPLSANSGLFQKKRPVKRNDPSFGG